LRKNGVDAATHGNSSDYNLLLALGAILCKSGWAGETAFALADWQRVSGQDSHSREGDPHFIAPIMHDFRLQPDSIALQAGEIISEISLDYFGNVRSPGKTSIGACEKAILDYPRSAARLSSGDE
jgi:hypothetical protein